MVVIDCPAAVGCGVGTLLLFVTAAVVVAGFA
jgi:hypothetical protein